MTDKSTPTKKDFISNDKNSNNQSASTNIINPETTLPIQNLLNTEENKQKNTQNFTFKIIKRRAPWNKKEDEAIIELVNKYGTSNWTIIANQMASIFNSKHRNGKQCRERWHNHLDPIVNKENWTEEEENILFNKHLEYGNKWSDIAKYLPGRTDNSIKNHFYSKLRKFIRKILKQINKENLLKNNGIDYCKYNSDKVYKLLKKYKITYKNVTKDTILNLIIATEKNQKGKIFGINDDSKIKNNNLNNENRTKNNDISHIPFCLDNNLLNNSKDKSTIKKSKIKAKLKNSDGKNQNDSLIKKDKKIFQSNIGGEIEPIKDDLICNNNLDNLKEQKFIKSSRKYKRKNKNLDNDDKIENNDNTDNKKNINIIKKQLTINPEYVQETYIFKNKSKSKIKGIKNNENKKLLNKKRRRKKRRKVSISLSTPENKKTQISRIMPGRKFIFGFGKKLPIENKTNKNSLKNKKNKYEINPEDFDSNINEVEIIREGLEIHSKSIILINKSLITEKLFPENNYQYKPNSNLNISIPLTPNNQQFPNISIGLPTPMEGYYEPQISPIGQYMMFPPPSTKNIFNVDFGFENHFFRKNFPNSFTPKGFFSGSILSQNTPKKAINLKNKIVIQNNNNLNGDENVDTNIQENSKKPAALNLELIENCNNENNNPYQPYALFGVNENGGSSVAKQITTPANFFNLSPTSPFMPKTFGEKNL